MQIQETFRVSSLLEKEKSDNGTPEFSFFRVSGILAFLGHLGCLG